MEVEEVAKVLEGEQVTEVVREDTRQVAMVEEALGRLEQVTQAELWGRTRSSAGWRKTDAWFLPPPAILGPCR